MTTPPRTASKNKSTEKRPPEPNPAPADKAGTGTPLLKPLAPSSGQAGAKKG